MSLGGIIVTICAAIFFAYLIRLSFLEWRLIQGRWPDGYNGEYEEVRAILPIIVSGQLIWIRRYRRTFVSTMAGGFVKSWLPEKNN